MAKAKKIEFHGHFGKRAAAVSKAKEVGGRVCERKISGKPRYFVLTATEGK